MTAILSSRLQSHVHSEHKVRVLSCLPSQLSLFQHKMPFDFRQGTNPWLRITMRQPVSARLAIAEIPALDGKNNIYKALLC